jgi:hypothetical protein
VFGSCGYYSTIGGYGISAGTSTVLSKNNISLSGHYRVKILVDVLFIDSWDNESFFMEVNGVKVITNTHSLNSATRAVCGSQSWKDKMKTFEYETAHTSSEIDISFFANLNEGATNEAWGVRNFQIWIMPCNYPCLNCSGDPDNCVSCASTALRSAAPSCTCTANVSIEKGSVANGGCAACNYKCSTCVT